MRALNGSRRQAARPVFLSFVCRSTRLSCLLFPTLPAQSPLRLPLASLAGKIPQSFVPENPSI